MTDIAALPALARALPPGPEAALVLLRIGEAGWRLRIEGGALRAVEAAPGFMPRCDLSLTAEPAGWARYTAATPPPGWQDLFGLLRFGALAVEGDVRLFMAHLAWFKALFALLRPSGPARAEPAAPPPGPPAFEPITGRYLRLAIDGVPHRVYVEEAGEGIPLLLLHTAGSDGRQWRGLLNDPAVTARFRCIAFDLPWHGKSSPPAGRAAGEYRLTTEGYTGIILAIAEALGLDRPAVIGCSIGGRIVLNLAADHPERFRAVIGLQSGAFLDPYYDTAWLNHPEVHGGAACAAVVSGLIGPSASAADRAETLWHYSQGGPGVFKGDLFFYKGGDLREKLPRIDTARCPVFLLTGDHDYSCRPEDTRAVAAAIRGAEAVIMPGIGHFPMSEDWPGLRAHLLPVLARIPG